MVAVLRAMNVRNFWSNSPSLFSDSSSSSALPAAKRAAIADADEYISTCRFLPRWRMMKTLKIHGCEAAAMGFSFASSEGEDHLALGLLKRCLAFRHPAQRLHTQGLEALLFGHGLDGAHAGLVPDQVEYLVVRLQQLHDCSESVIPAPLAPRAAVVVSGRVQVLRRFQPHFREELGVGCSHGGRDLAHRAEDADQTLGLGGDQRVCHHRSEQRR